MSKKKHYVVSFDTDDIYIIDVKAKNKKKAEKKAHKILDKNSTYYSKKLVMCARSFSRVEVSGPKG